MQVIALFGPTGVGKTAVAIAIARRLRNRGEDPVAISADALQVYTGLETLTGVAGAEESTELEHRLVSCVPLDETFSAGAYSKLAHAEIDGLLAAGRRPIVVGGTGLYLRAALGELDFKPTPPGGESQLWSKDMRRPTLLIGLTMERAALYARIDARVQVMLDAGVSEEVRRAHEAGVSVTARKALGFEELLEGDVEAMKRNTRNYAKRQLTWMRKMAGVRMIDVTGCEADDVATEIVPLLSGGAGLSGRGAGPLPTTPRPSEIRPPSRLRRRMTMQFEKWQALGNDYIIVERDECPFELTRARVRRLCEDHVGVGADGVLLLAPPKDPEHVADLRIFNPDGSEAELSGNGAREAIMYLRKRGWTDRDEFAVGTAAGTIRPTITGDDTCRVDMGRASLTSKNYPGGAPDGRGEVTAGEKTWRFRHVSIGNPQCAIHIASEAELEALDLEEIGPGIEGDKQFPNRTNVSWYTQLESSHGDQGARIRARIFERGVGETLSSGTGATGAAVAYALEHSPGQAARVGGVHVTVVLDGGELEVEVGEDLHVDLAGWARPVYAGRLSEGFVNELKELHETE